MTPYTILFSVASLLVLSACIPLATTGAAKTGVTIAQERTVGTAVDDTVIFADIKRRYLEKDVNDLLINVGVEVIEGAVYLTGNVKNPDTVIEAVNLAWQVDGVKEVVNEIQATDKSSIKDYALDSWIETQIETRLLLGKKIRSINYTVEVVNSIVYVMGIAQSEDELGRVMNVARTTKYVKQVVSHVRLKTDSRRGKNG